MKLAPQLGHLRFLKAKQQMNPNGNKMMAKKMPRKVKESSRTPTLWREEGALVFVRALGRAPHKRGQRAPGASATVPRSSPRPQQRARYTGACRPLLATATAQGVKGREAT